MCLLVAASVAFVGSFQRVYRIEAEEITAA
jgi:hypothetical protein